MRLILPSFNAGELSPKLHSRVELEKYSSGCKTLENFVIMPYGGVVRRPGLEYLGAIGDETEKARLAAFSFSTTTNFVLEFGDLYVRFWSNGELVESGGNPVEVVTPYAAAEVFELQMVQVNDVVYIVHPEHAPAKLSRLSDTSWTYAAIEWDYPPFQDENLTATTITPSATTGAINLVASAAVFEAGDVGGYYEIGHTRATMNVTRALTGAGTSSTLRVLGKWDLTTFGTWGAGTVFLEQSSDGSTGWETLRSWESTASNQRNVQANGDLEEEKYLRIRYTGSGNSGSTANLEAAEALVKGVVKITGFTDSTHAAGTVTRTLSATTATTHWSEGAFSTRRGFPRSVCLHQQRLIFGGTEFQAQTVWGSLVDDFHKFLFSEKDDAAFAFTIASSARNSVNWIASQREALVVGTTGEEYTVSPSESNGVITPTNVTVKRETRYGSKYLPAILVNDATLFIQRQGSKMREFTYSFERDAYVAPDLTLLAEHVTRAGVVQTAFQQQPDAILWCILEDGTLAGLTYEREENVVGWHRHVTDGFFESVAVIYGSAGDEVWTVVRRTIDGDTRRYVERLDTAYREALDDEDKSRWFYVDSGKLIEAPGDVVIDGLDHLEGKTVAVLADGAVVGGSHVVTGGEITLPREYETVVVGLPYTSTLQPLPVEVPMRDGTSQGRRFSVVKVDIRFYKSLGGKVEVSPGTWDVVPFRDTSMPTDESPPAFTGTKPFTLAGQYNETAEIKIRQEQPLPMCILALIPVLQVYGD